MKFSRSERELHPNNQSVPPCNTYNLRINKGFDHEPVTGSLKGPSIIERNTFGFDKRFDNAD